MRVLKFGGSSVADAERLRRCARIVAAGQAAGPLVVVVSAMAGVTDGLLRVAAAAQAGNTAVWRAELARVERQHVAAYCALAGAVPERFADAWVAVSRDAATLAAGPRSSSGDEARAAAERFSGWGERLVVDLFALALALESVQARALTEAPVRLRGERWPAAPVAPSVLATRGWLAPKLAPVLARGGVVVLPGYIARDAAGLVTTLGRNGSDLSAAVVAAALGAQAVTLYSDVAGIYTADPRVVPEARLLPSLTYAEAAAIAALGARVLHPATVAPLVTMGISLALRSALAPEAPGTVIAPAAEAGAVTGCRWVVAASQAAGSACPGAPVMGGGVTVTALALGEPVTRVRLLTRAAAALERLLPSAGWDPLRLEAPSLHLIVRADQAATAQRALHAALMAAGRALPACAPSVDDTHGGTCLPAPVRATG